MASFQIHIKTRLFSWKCKFLPWEADLRFLIFKSFFLYVKTYFYRATFAKMGDIPYCEYS